jgi:hypothetical protein
MSSLEASPRRASWSSLWAWSSERFPWPMILIGLVPIYVAALCAGRFVDAGGAPGAAVAFRPLDVPGLVAMVSFVLVLRVFDEHKDYDKDCVAHPDRVLQRGLVTLRQLRWVAAVAIAVQVAVSVAYDGGLGAVSAAWAAAFGWSLLMLVEFFCGEWLAPRLLPYALTHTVVTPLILLWVFTMGAGDIAWSALLGWLLVNSFFTSLAFEVSRKSVAPADERPEVDTYSRRYGSRRVAALCSALMVGGTLASVAAVGTVQNHLDAWAAPGAAWVVVLAVAAVAGCAAAVAYGRRPTPSAAKALEACCPLVNVVAQIVVAVAVLTQGSAQWR